jgi:hypothetical protein
MNEETTVEQRVDQEVIDHGRKRGAPCVKTKTKAKTKNLKCRECEKKENAVRKVATMGGKVVVGLGTGVFVGVGLLSAAAIAEVAIPAILTFKALGLTGGALGLVKGAKEFDE